MNDPLFQDEKRQRRIANDPQIIATFSRTHWIRVAIGLAALALIAAIWLNWRMGS